MVFELETIPIASIDVLVCQFSQLLLMNCAFVFAGSR